MYMKLLMGAVFTLFGSLFGGAGMWIALNFETEQHHITGNGPAWLLPVMFILFGGICIILGVCFICRSVKRIRRTNEVVKLGQHELGTVIDFQDDPSMMVNGVYCYRVVVYCGDCGIYLLSGSISPNFRGPEIGDILDCYIDGDDACIMLRNRRLSACVAEKQ